MDIHCQSHQCERVMPRRRFYSTLIFGIWTLISMTTGTFAAVYSLVPHSRARGRKAGWIDIADVSDLNLDAPREVVFHQNRTDAWKVSRQKITAWLIRQADNSVIAISPQCTHLGCNTNWNAER